MEMNKKYSQQKNTTTNRDDEATKAKQRNQEATMEQKKWSLSKHSKQKKEIKDDKYRM